MKISVNLVFRYERSIIQSTLPTDLTFIPNVLIDRSSSKYYAGKLPEEIAADRNLVERIIQYGKQERDSKTLIKNIRISKTYEREDLEGLSVVEIFPVIKMVPDPFEVPITREPEATFSAAWECRHCRRVSWRQEQDIRATPLNPLDFDITDTYN